MRTKLIIKLASTARIGRALGRDCRGNGGRRFGLMLVENRSARTRKFLLSERYGAIWTLKTERLVIFTPS